MKTVREYLAVLSAALLVHPATSFGANHREAPITAVDRAADITDVFAFVSYDRPDYVTMIMNVDPLLEPGNGPNYFPFDQDIVYAINVDNNNDALADLSFQFRFTTEVRAPNVFTGFIGAGTGVPVPTNAPNAGQPFTGTAGQPGAGNSPLPGTTLIPGAITRLDGAGSEGLNLRQSYTVTMVMVPGGTTSSTGGANASNNQGLTAGTGTGTGSSGSGSGSGASGGMGTGTASTGSSGGSSGGSLTEGSRRPLQVSGGTGGGGNPATGSFMTTSLAPASGRLFAVPTNVGPRTMPNYTALAQQGIYTLNVPALGTNSQPTTARVFAGTADDPFFIDLGAVFDSLNLRPGAFTSGTTGVLSPTQDAANSNSAPDYVAGYNVNTIAIEVPIALLTRGGVRPGASDPAATIGIWATTSRPRDTIRRTPAEQAAATSTGTPSAINPAPGTVSSVLPSAAATTDYRQVQRMGNPLINEVIIGTGFKDAFSTSQPVNDAQFANFFLDPLLSRALNAVFGIAVPNAPRTDLLPLVTYAPPIAARGTTAGPVADLLRLNVGVPPTPMSSRSRLGALGGDSAGFPNGRRVTDDVTDIALRVVAGALAGAPFNISPNVALGDGVNVNPEGPTQETFPYVRFANSGRDTPTRMRPGLGSIDCVSNPLNPACL